MATYEEVLKDYDELMRLHDHDSPDDMTGGYIEGDEYMELLRNPSKRNAKEHLISIMEYSSYKGFERVGPARIHMPEVREIYEKYGIQL